MKKRDRRLWWVVIIFSIIAFSSCAYDKEFAYLNDQIIVLNKRVGQMQELIDARLSSDFESIRSNQVEFRLEIDELKRETGEMSGRVEDNERLIKHAVERDLNDQDSTQVGVARLSQKVAALQMMVRQQQDYLGLEPITIQEDQKEEEEIDRRAIAVDEELKLYDMSLAFFHEGKFEEAMDGFKQYLKEYAKSDRADNAQFWIGECYMALKQYEQAILSYQEVIKKYPKGNKVPNAMLRQAVAFMEIKDKTSTRLLLNKIIKVYPKSHEAEIARKRLKALK